EVDSGETHSAKESARELKQLRPEGARIQLDENAGDERGVTNRTYGVLSVPSPERRAMSAKEESGHRVCHRRLRVSSPRQLHG
ncbi:MAG: hypothetical protein WCK86_11480, partial [Planctomycetia bacterium]